MRKHDYGVNLFVPAHVVNVIDGDTVDVHILDSDHQSVEKVRIRIARIDAPEHDGPAPAAALASELYLRKLLEARVAMVRPIHAWTDPYGRIIADVWNAAGDVATQMIVAGHAVRYLNLAQRNLRAARARLNQARARKPQTS